MGWRNLFKRKPKRPIHALKADIYNGVVFLTGGAAFLSLKFYILFERLFRMGGTRLLSYENVTLAGFSFSDWFAILGAALMLWGAFLIIHGFAKYEKTAWLDY